MTRTILVSLILFSLLWSATLTARADEKPAPNVLADIAARLSTPPSPAPQRTLIYGTTFSTADFSTSGATPEYSDSVQNFIAATGATALAAGELGNLAATPNGLRRGVQKINGRDAAQIAVFINAPKSEKIASEKIAVVDLGENLNWPLTNNSIDFQNWLRALDLPLDFLDDNAKSWDEIRFSIAPEIANTKPALYYYAHLFAREFALRNWAEKTAALKLIFPNAGISGRFVPRDESTPFGEVASHIGAFQKGALTMPRVDLQRADSIADFYEIDLLRAGIRGRETNLDAKIYADISAPTREKPDAWRKRFYGAILHGAKIFDIGDFRPTEIQAPRELKRALSELSTFENIVQDGKLKSAQTALLISETGEIWNNATDARRALYEAARANQIPLDFISESEVQNGDLKNYKVLLLADRNLSRKAAKAVFDWVQSGGNLIAIAGAGMRDELDKKNILLFEQLGIRELEYSESGATLENTSVNSIPMGSVKWDDKTFPVFDALSRFDATAIDGQQSEVRATFEDGSPALIFKRAGEGSVVYTGFRPRMNGANSIWTASRLMAFALRRVYRPVVCFAGPDEIPSVETSVIESAEGLVIPLVNRSGKPIKKLAVRFPFLATYRSCALASGGRVLLNRDELGLFAIFDLGAADALIFK